MTERTGSEKYMLAIEYAHYYINNDVLRVAQILLDEARCARHDLEIEAHVLTDLGES